MMNNPLNNLIKLRLLLAAVLIHLALPGIVLADDTIKVYKSPTCGCCSAWVDHLRAEGFEVTAFNVMDMNSIKQRLGVTPRLSSCHTAVVDGYVIEGHVPASDIRRLLEERPKVTGLTVPGMPMGSPGMEGPRKDKYQVLTFDDQNETAVYSQY